MSEAAATWQWNNFLEGQAALGQVVVVHINLDETCVKIVSMRATWCCRY